MLFDAMKICALIIFTYITTGFMGKNAWADEGKKREKRVSLSGRVYINN